MIKKSIFILIIFLAFFLRFYKLGGVPLSLNWDENSNAYNAYSILKTSRDEYGNLLPLSNRSFDDYKPPLYMYLNVPTVAIFGLTPFAARLPSAIFGFLTIPLIYLLTRKLFENSKLILEIRNLKLGIPTLAMLMLAISPWHIQFSRVGFEATVGLFFAVAAITTFLYGLDNKKWLIPSAIFLGISAYSYHAERIFLPLLFIATFVIWRKEILTISKKYLIIFSFITVLIGLPLVVLAPQKIILQRFETTSGGSKLEDIEQSIKFILHDLDEGSDLGRYIHNRRFVIGQTWFSNYLSHFDFNFLFTKGDDNFRHHIEGMGMLYLFELPLVLYGIFMLIKKHDKSSMFLLSWLILAPVSAAPAVPNPHAIRSFQIVIPFEIISAYSLVLIFSTKIFLRKQLFYLFLFGILASFTIYLHNYWTHYIYDKADLWQYGYSQAVLESEKVKDNYKKINIDRSIEQAYIYWLFNTKYDPATYQKSGDRHQFDKYQFDAETPTNPKELFISDTGRFPGGFEVTKTIYYPNGKEAIKIGHPR